MFIGVLQSYPVRKLFIFEADYWSVSEEYGRVTISDKEEGAIAAFCTWEMIARHEDRAALRKMMLPRSLPEGK